MDCQVKIPTWPLPSGVVPISLQEQSRLSPAAPPVHPSWHPPFHYDEVLGERHILLYFQWPENLCAVYSSWAARAVSCRRRRPDDIWIAWPWIFWWVREGNRQDEAGMPCPEDWWVLSERKIQDSLVYKCCNACNFLATESWLVKHENYIQTKSN